MKKILVFCLYLFSMTAFADFSGKWSGTGSAQNALGWAAACTQMQFDIVQTPQALLINRAHFVCGDLGEDWSSFSLQIKNQELWSEGKKVGSITDKAIHAEYSDGKSSIAATYDAELTSNGLSYRNVDINSQSGEIVFQMEGLLDSPTQN